MSVCAITSFIYFFKCVVMVKFVIIVIMFFKHNLQSAWNVIVKFISIKFCKILCCPGALTGLFYSLTGVLFLFI